MNRVVMLAGLAISFLLTIGLAATSSGALGHVADSLAVFLGFMAVFVLVEGAS